MGAIFIMSYFRTRDITICNPLGFAGKYSGCLRKTAGREDDWNKNAFSKFSMDILHHPVSATFKDQISHVGFWLYILSRANSWKDKE